MLASTFKILKRTLLIAVILLVLLVGGTALYVRFFPINITPFAEKILPYVAPNFNITFSELWLKHDGKFTVSAENVAFEGNPNNANSTNTNKIGGIERLEFRLSNRSLLWLKPSPKHIVLSGLYYEGEINTDSAQKSAKPNKLNEFTKLIKRMRYLSTLELSKINIILQDVTTGTQWALKNGQGQGTYYGENGLNIKLNGQLAQNKEKLAPAEITLQTDPSSQTTNLSVNLSYVNSGWIKPYLPTAKKDIFQGQISLRFGSNWSPKAGWSPLLIKSEINDITLNIPQIYKTPHTFQSASIAAQYNLNNKNIKLINLNIKDKDFNLNLSGDIKDLKNNITAKLEGSIVTEKAENLFAHLPSARMKKVLPWMQENIKGTFATSVTIALDAPLKTLFKCAPNIACPGLTIAAGINPNSQIKPLKQAPAVIAQAPSQFYMRNGQIEVIIPAGTIGQQKVKNITAILTNLQTLPQNPRILKVESTASGNMQESVPIIKDIFKIDLPYNLNGQHASAISIAIPFYKGVPPVAENISMTLNSQIKSASLINGLNNKPLALNNAKLTLKDGILRANGQANYSDMPLNFTYKNILKTKKTTGTLQGSTNLKNLPFNLPKFLDLSGTVPLNITYTKTGKTTPLQLEIKTDLTQATASIPKLNWQHRPGTPLKFNLQGTLQGNALNAELFTLTGSANNTLNNARQNTEIAGSFYYVPNAKTSELTLQASPFILGSTNANITYDNNNLTITGKNLDLTRALATPDNGQINWPENFKSTINLDRVLLKNGYVQSLKINANRPNNKWENFTITGALPDATNFNANFKPTPEGYRFQTRFSNLGAFLTNVGITEKMHGGQLIGQLNLDKQRNGSGTFTLNNTRLINAPVLVKLISLLSLDQLLSNNAGIEFETGIFPIHKKGASYSLKKAFLTGPAMALNFNGDILPLEKYINIDGELVPTAGINRAVNSIPILGDLLTGSQDGIFVAEFKVKGPWQKPEISVKPLSTVTPGIIKDFFNIFTGKNKDK